MHRALSRISTGANPIEYSPNCRKLEQLILTIGAPVKKAILSGFDKAVSQLKRVLDEDVFLEEQDQLFIENRLLLLQVAYAEWKSRKHNKEPAP